LTILAYERNGAPLGVLHGLPLRLRCENTRGFRMVKSIQVGNVAPELSRRGAGNGGDYENQPSADITCQSDR